VGQSWQAALQVRLKVLVDKTLAKTKLPSHPHRPPPRGVLLPFHLPCHGLQSVIWQSDNLVIRVQEVVPGLMTRPSVDERRPHRWISQGGGSEEQRRSPDVRTMGRHSAVAISQHFPIARCQCCSARATRSLDFPLVSFWLLASSGPPWGCLLPGLVLPCRPALPCRLR
jgi:hypothetical protein